MILDWTGFSLISWILQLACADLDHGRTQFRSSVGRSKDITLMHPGIADTVARADIEVGEAFLNYEWNQDTIQVE